MKIVNLVKHPKPLQVGKEYVQLYSFDIELEGKDFTLTWVGWSIRIYTTENQVRLQAPRIAQHSSTKKGSAVLFSNIKNEALPILVRQILKKDHDLDVDLPVKVSIQPKKNPYQKPSRDFKRNFRKC